jgi:hypothetical protein
LPDGSCVGVSPGPCAKGGGVVRNGQDCASLQPGCAPFDGGVFAPTPDLSSPADLATTRPPDLSRPLPDLTSARPEDLSSRTADLARTLPPDFQ